MKTTNLLELQKQASALIEKITYTISATTADKPLFLFDKDDLDMENLDELYDLPYGYHVNKYEQYEQGAIYKVQGKEVILFGTSENWGELYYQDICDIPFSSLVDLLSYIKSDNDVFQDMMDKSDMPQD